MRPIDADALKYRRKDYGGYDDVTDEERKRGILFLLKEDIAAAPTIDAVPVVRCKECRFSVVNENIDRKPLICGKTKMCGETTPDWFCAAGERSEE